MLEILFSGGSGLIARLLVYTLSAVVVIFFASPVHEFAHAWSANRLGDPTPRYQGRLTINPLAHIDYIGALLILLFGFGWAKPVPVNPRNFRDPKRGMALTAAAGPISNLCFAFVALLLGQVVYHLLLAFLPATSESSAAVIFYTYHFFQSLASINLSLCVFNLIPIPPLDGSRILGLFLSDRAYYRLMQYERQLYFLMILLLATGIVSRPLGYAVNGIYTALYNLTALPFRLFQ